MKFEWDAKKNAANLRKHNIDFEEASTVFDDHHSLEQKSAFKGENRIVRLGKSTRKFILLVVYTLRSSVVRIISARQAGQSERNIYVGHKLEEQAKDEEANGK